MEPITTPLPQKFDIENLDLVVYHAFKRHPIISYGALVLLLATIVAPFVMELVRGENLLTQKAVYAESVPLLFALHLFTDLAIGFAYIAITVMLIYFAYKAGRSIPFLWAFVAFGVFIIACGATHIMEALVLWKPIYWVAGGIKWLTAVVSVGTALAIPPLIPRGLELIAIARTTREQKEQIARQNERLEAINKEVTRNAAELAASNKVMVDRELKMVELKKEVATLEGRLKEHEPSE